MNKGLTLIEILVVIGIIILIFGAGSFINFSSYNHTLINTEQSTLVSVLSKARSEAMNNVNHIQHGVHIDTDTYTLFEGTVYTAGVPANQDISKNSKTVVSNLGVTTFTTPYDIYFNQLSGDPSATGIITLTDISNSTNTKTITIKTGGLIDW